MSSQTIKSIDSIYEIDKTLVFLKELGKIYQGLLVNVRIVNGSIKLTITTALAQNRPMFERMMRLSFQYSHKLLKVNQQCPIKSQYQRTYSKDSGCGVDIIFSHALKHEFGIRKVYAKLLHKN